MHVAKPIGPGGALVRPGLEHRPKAQAQGHGSDGQMLLYTSHVWSLHVKIRLLAQFDTVCWPLQATGSSAKRAVALPDRLQEVWQVNALLLHLVIEIADSPALIPRCPSILAQLRNDPVPVQVIADEHQFRHGPVRMGVRMQMAMVGC